MSLKNKLIAMIFVLLLVFTTTTSCGTTKNIAIIKDSSGKTVDTIPLSRFLLEAYSQYLTIEMNYNYYEYMFDNNDNWIEQIIYSLDFHKNKIPENIITREINYY